MDKLNEYVGSKAIECKLDLPAQKISIGDYLIDFDIDAAWKTKLINGWDDIDLTLSRTEEIKLYRERRSRNIPWAWPVENTNIGE